MSHCKPFEEGARIYYQTNGTIRERRDDIQPGDIIEMVRFPCTPPSPPIKR